jgi:hypothetical protein
VWKVSAGGLPRTNEGSWLERTIRDRQGLSDLKQIDTLLHQQSGHWWPYRSHKPFIGHDNQVNLLWYSPIPNAEFMTWERAKMSERLRERSFIAHLINTVFHVLFHDVRHFITTPCRT